MKFLNNYSNRELNMWARLTLDILVSVYFISKISPLIINYQFYSNELMRDALVPIILTTVVIAIIYSIIVFGTIWMVAETSNHDFLVFLTFFHNYYTKICDIWLT